MAIFIRILTIFYLILSIVSFGLGSMLFARRELLKGRTQKLENTLIEVAGFIEEEDAPEIGNDFKGRDASDVTAEELPESEIEFDSFWETYDFRLEDQERSLVNLGTKRDALMSYYKRDFTGKIESDPNTGYPVMTGKGTMHDLLEAFKERVVKQHTRLNLTRQQLTVLREETESAITELNERKVTLRGKLAQIVSLNNTISDLNSRIADLQNQISDLQGQVRSLQDDVAVRDENIRKLEEDIKIKDERIVGYKDEIEELRTAIANQGGGGSIDAGGRGVDRRHIEPGRKGTVVSVNAEWGYIVFEAGKDFIGELDTINRTLERHLEAGDIPSVPTVELLVKRGKTFKKFVSKVRLRQLDRDNSLAVGDIMTDWQQSEIEVGDVIFY